MVGIIGTGLMGSNLARCLRSKGYELVFYNRTRSKAEKLAGEIGGLVVESPREAAENSDVLILFIPDDDALHSIVFGEKGLGTYNGRVVVLNASTVTPMASLKAYSFLRERSIWYLEAPVYGSVSEARECRLFSLIAGKEEVFDNVRSVVEEYSGKVVYVGSIPSASALKLALNNIGLAMPALLAESLSLLKAWGVNKEKFLEVVNNLWFGDAVKRYWGRIYGEKPPRFRVWMAGKDYRYVSEALREKKQPALLSSAISAMYYIASMHGYGDKDYPRMAHYFIEKALKKN
jgi:3-hydroxyisobutyrate dehydrogenase